MPGLGLYCAGFGRLGFQALPLRSLRQYSLIYRHRAWVSGFCDVRVVVLRCQENKQLCTTSLVT